MHVWNLSLVSLRALGLPLSSPHDHAIQCDPRSIRTVVCELSYQSHKFSMHNDIPAAVTQCACSVIVIYTSCCQMVMRAWGMVPLPLCACTFQRRPVVVTHMVCACIWETKVSETRVVYAWFRGRVKCHFTT